MFPDVQNRARPINKSKVCSFPRLCTYRRSVKNFANITKPLRRLMEDKSVFVLGKECEIGFRRLKAALCSVTILTFPKMKGQFVLNIYDRQCRTKPCGYP